MNAVLAYQFEDEPVRVIMRGDEPWFVANDVCRVLAIVNPRDAVGRLDNDEWDDVGITDAIGREQQTNIVSESGMYALIFRSRKAEAKRFRKWVTSEVLPSIRRTGKYVLYEPPAVPEVALDLDVPRINASVALVREGRRLFGPRTARELWVRMGLPVSIAEAQAAQLGDALAEPLRQWLVGRSVCTTHGAAQAMGIDDPSPSDKMRIAALLRAYGWMPKAQRIDGKKENAWNSPTGDSWHGVVAGETGL